MLSRFASIALVTVLVCTLGGPTAFARASSDPEVKLKVGEAVPETRIDLEKGTKSDPKLRADLLDLVAKAKAGKVSLADPQIQAAKRNNLSKGQKIAIGVGIAVAVVVVVVAVSHRGPGRVF